MLRAGGRGYHGEMDGSREKLVAIRRWGDACFHYVDEVVEEGFILGSVLIPNDEVLEVREVEVGADGAPLSCGRWAVELKVESKTDNRG